MFIHYLKWIFSKKNIFKFLKIISQILFLFFYWIFQFMANFSGRANGSDSDPLGSFNASEFAEKLKAAGAGEEEAKAEDEGKVEVEEEVVNAEKTEL